MSAQFEVCTICGKMRVRCIMLQEEKNGEQVYLCPEHRMRRDRNGKWVPKVRGRRRRTQLV